MKKIVLIFAFCALPLIAQSQNVSVEKSIFGIQTGFLGIWVHNESKLSNQFVLRSELGLDSGIYGNDDNVGLFFAPTVTIEPRWHYNLNKRKKKDKRIDENSGNFISVKTTYYTDWFTIAKEDNINIASAIAIIPSWGIKRNIGNHFNYEVSSGIGYVQYLEKRSNESGIGIGLHLRIGYRF